ncbi:MAG TPA: lytic murein transglycosylase [Hyphomicrobiales bacterium]|nr:lytic murein transglycosylase [Hyphomicrobiales bacterium]
MPTLRGLRLLALAALLLLALPPTASAEDFQAFLQSLWPEAQALGVSRETFGAATRDLQPDLSLPDLVLPGRPARPARQAEFAQLPGAYVSESVVARLAAQGRAVAAADRATLAAIERRFGVPPAVLLAIWGRETNFGRARLPYDAVRTLATQAWAGRRKERFRREFVLALKMLQMGVAPRAEMKSSWAGAMGQTQFLPSDYLRDAVDFDGDGRADIWRSVPDALASAARQLVDKGWHIGGGWAWEVRPPAGFDCAEAEPDVRRSVGAWIAAGLRPIGSRQPSGGDGEAASVFLPAGTHGPAFLTPANFYVFKAYNFSDLYALFVGHLADRIGGAGPFATPWGKVSQADAQGIAFMQQTMTRDGLYHDKIDGRAGQKTKAAIGAWQKRHGLAVDCWPSPAIAAAMRSGR